MKHKSELLKFFFIVVVIGVTTGNEESQGEVAISDTVSRTTPQEANDPAPLYMKLPTIGGPCFITLRGNDTTVFHKENVTSEEIQTYFDGMCTRQSSLRECLEEKTSSLESDEDQTIRKTYDIFRDLAVNIFNSVCEDGAKRGVDLINWSNTLATSRPMYGEFKKCDAYMANVLRTVDDGDVDIASKVFMYNKELSNIFECLNRLNEYLPSKEVFEYLSNQVLTTMKCIHPQDGTLVLCTSISVDLISVPTVCDLKTNNNKLVMHDVLEDDVGSCFNIMTLDAREQDTTSDIGTLRDDIDRFCSKKRIVLRCINDTKIFSNKCLNESQNNEFKLLSDSVRKGLDAACLEDGKRLTDIMFEVYRLKRTGNGHAVWDCVDAAKSTRNELDEHTSSSMNMRFYHELETFKGCLVNKLGGDITSVASATSLIDETLKIIECVNVADGTTVTCESLMHHQH